MVRQRRAALGSATFVTRHGEVSALLLQQTHERDAVIESSPVHRGAADRIAVVDAVLDYLGRLVPPRVPPHRADALLKLEGVPRFRLHVTLR
jgi:hypothetical protein